MERRINLYTNTDHKNDAKKLLISARTLYTNKNKHNVDRGKKTKCYKNPDKNFFKSFVGTLTKC